MSKQKIFSEPETLAIVGCPKEWLRAWVAKQFGSVRGPVAHSAGEVERIKRKWEAEQREVAR